MEVTHPKLSKKQCLATLKEVVKASNLLWVKTWHPLGTTEKQTSSHSYSLEPESFIPHKGHQLFAEPYDEAINLSKEDLQHLCDIISNAEVVDAYLIGVAKDKYGEHAGEVRTFLRIKQSI